MSRRRRYRRDVPAAGPVEVRRVGDDSGAVVRVEQARRGRNVRGREPGAAVADGQADDVQTDGPHGSLHARCHRCGHLGFRFGAGLCGTCVYEGPQ